MLIIVSCSTRNAEELQRLNELETELLDNQENLNIDIEAFNFRLTQMEVDLNYFKTELGDTISIEFSNQLSKYNVIRKIYSKNINTFATCVKEQSELEEQLKDLKLDLQEGNISKEEFKSYYRQEKIDIEALIVESQELKKSLYQVEPDYRRISEIVAKRLELVNSKLPQ